MKHKILVMDDEVNVRDVLKRVLEKEGFEVRTAENGKEGLEILASDPCDLVLADIKMPEMDGMEFLENAKERGIKSIIIMMSAFGTIKTVIKAVKKGAYYYVSKPFDIDEVLVIIKKALDERALREENERLKRELERKYSFEGIIGRSKPMEQVFSLVEKGRDYDVSVLITGESGTGKELVARALHFSGERKRGVFVPVNCAALPESLIETELFGYRKGAFTDARNDKKGLIEEADGGTLFLDEIPELSMPVQAKLLRFLQEGEIRRVGDTESRSVDVRVIAATSKKLNEEVARGSFREDLFYRLNKLVIHMPPLRERKEDIFPLVEHFVNIFSQKVDKKIKGFSEEASRLMTEYDWPGNVRELENVVERAVVMADTEIINPNFLEGFGEETKKESVITPMEFDPEKITLKEAIKELEMDMIKKALRKTGGRKPLAAKILGISHPALLYKIKEYNIN